MTHERSLSTPGPRPFGTRPGEAKAVRLILRRRSKGATWQAIADELNSAGMAQRNGKSWTVGRVSGVWNYHSAANPVG